MVKPNKDKPLRYPEDTRQLNNFTSNRNLRRFLAQTDPDFLNRHFDTLCSLGAFSSGALDAQAEYSDQVHPPAFVRDLDRTSAPQKRIGRVVLNDRYKDCQQELYRHGVIAKCFERQDPAPHMLAFLAQYMASYSDISTGCPLAMTHPDALILATRAPQNIRDRFLPQFLRTDGKTMVGATWATEWAGGSDVRGNTKTRAVLLDKQSGRCVVDGQNFFTSAMGFDSWGAIKTVRMTGADGKEGIALVFVPRFTDEKWDEDEAQRQLNNIDVSYLKKKSGTRGLATVEVELEGAAGYLIVGPEDGLRVMMEALGCSRIHNAMAAAGVMHRAYVEAMSWAQHRTAFGKTIDQYEDLQEDLLKLKVAWLGASALAFEAAKSFDETIDDPSRAVWLRVATALAKFNTAEKATESTGRATEIVGGIGYTQDHAIERVHRDAMVLRVWEGPKNIQARELVYILQHGGAQAFTDRLDEIISALEGAEEMRKEKTRLLYIRSKLGHALDELLARPEQGQIAGQRFMKSMASALGYALLCEEAQRELEAYSDMSKQLVASAYYEEHYNADVKPSLGKSILHEHFNEIAQDIPISPGFVPSKPSPR